MRQVIAAASRVTGLQLTEHVAARRAGDPAVLVASSARARRELTWKPGSPELEKMVGDAWHFLQGRQG